MLQRYNLPCIELKMDWPETVKSLQRFYESQKNSPADFSKNNFWPEYQYKTLIKKKLKIFFSLLLKFQLNFFFIFFLLKVKPDQAKKKIKK